MTCTLATPTHDFDAIQQLIVENQLLHEAIRHTPVPYGVYDNQGVLVAYSNAYTQTHPDLSAAIADAGGTVTYAYLMQRVLRGQVPDADLDQAVVDRVDALYQSDGTPQDRYYPELGWQRILRYRLPSGAVGGLAFDITELKDLEQDLRQAQAVAEESERLRTEFLANMSHEIRTPMNGVLGMAELLRHTDLDERQQLFADTIVRSGQDLLRIINDVLDVAKIEAGGLELDPAPFDPTEAIEDVSTLMSGKAAEKDLQLAVEFIGPMPACLIGDGARLRQIVTNLVGNAIKFTEKGYVLIRAGTSVCARNGGQPTTELTIEVEDTGVGIPADQQDLIFQKFKQADIDAPQRQEGTGLGLPIARALVSLMGGDIEVTSAQGQGSTFRLCIELPLGDADKSLKPLNCDVSGARILIVDDNAINRRILSEQMRIWNFQPVVTDNGPEALEFISKAWQDGTAFDLAIIDHRMPDMPGEELLRQIRLLPDYAGLPVVMLTSIDTPDTTRRLAHLGLTACLTKPPRSTQLYDTIVRAMAQPED